MFSTELDDSNDCYERCFVVEARFIDTNKASDLLRIWEVDNQTVEASGILDYVISDTSLDEPRTELISAIFLHKSQGLVSFQVIDTDNQTDIREIRIH